jgi:hypothetical protein
MTIRKRIARLIDEDLVNVVAVPTPWAVGMTVSAIIGISVQLPSLHAVSERLVGYPEVRYVGVATGRYDIIVEAFLNDQGHLLEFVSRKLGALKGGDRGRDQPDPQGGQVLLRVGDPLTAQPSLVRARRRLRIPWPMRCSFSIRAKRTWPSPPGPNPIPGEVATLASLTSMEANSTEPSSR